HLRRATPGGACSGRAVEELQVDRQPVRNDQETTVAWSAHRALAPRHVGVRDPDLLAVHPTEESQAVAADGLHVLEGHEVLRIHVTTVFHGGSLAPSHCNGDASSSRRLAGLARKLARCRPIPRACRSYNPTLPYAPFFSASGVRTADGGVAAADTEDFSRWHGTCCRTRTRPWAGGTYDERRRAAEHAS